MPQIKKWYIILLFFDYEKIYILAAGRSDKIIKLFKGLRNDPMIHLPIKGESFIVNEDVMWSSLYSPQELSEYLGILSIRNYQHYLLTGDPSLDMEYLYPWIPKAVVTNNPLIAIKQSKLIFEKEINNG